MERSIKAFEPICLEGKFVRLELLDESHKDGLSEAIKDGELWKLFVTLVPHPDAIDAFFDKTGADYEAGLSLPFATIDKRTNKVAGSTRFMKADMPNRRVEIGHTFIGKSWQRTAINTEAKWLMLRYAFESLGFNRVEFITDYLNDTSRRAVLRLGAKQEGILRNHMVMPNGRVRDSVVFSIIENEWPGVKQHLSNKLA